MTTRTLIWLCVCITSLMCASRSFSQAPAPALPSKSVELGTLKDDDWKSCRFLIPNVGPGDLVIDRVIPSCASCTRVDEFSKTTPAGGEAVVDVSVKAGAKRGALAFRLLVVGRDSPIHELIVTAYRLGLLLPQSDVYLGDVAPGGSTRRTFMVRSAGLGDVNIKVSGGGGGEFRVLGSQGVSTTPGGSDPRDLTHTFVGEFAPRSVELGSRAAQFTLTAYPATGGEPLCSTELVMRASVLPPVPADPPLVLLGAIAPGEVFDRIIKLDGASNENLDVDCDDSRIQVSIGPPPTPLGPRVVRVRYAATAEATGLLRASVRVTSGVNRNVQVIPVVGLHVLGTNLRSGPPDSASVTCVPVAMTTVTAAVQDVVDGIRARGNGIEGLIRVLDERFKAGLPPLSPVELGKVFMVGQEAGVLPRSDISDADRTRFMQSWSRTRSEGNVALQDLLEILEARRDLIGSSESELVVDIKNDAEIWSRVLNVPEQIASVREIARFAHADAFRMIERGRIFDDGTRQSVIIASDGVSRLVCPLPDGPAQLIEQTNYATFEAEDWALEAIGGLAGNRVRGTARAREYDLARFVAADGAQASAVEREGEWIDGWWTVRLRIGFGHSFVVWIAPELGFAPLRTEETYEQNSVVCKVTRIMSKFKEVVPGTYVPFQVIQHQNIVNGDGSLGAEYYRRTVTVESYRPNCYSAVHPPKLEQLIPPQARVVDQRRGSPPPTPSALPARPAEGNR